jgi:hypothetical protein
MDEKMTYITRDLLSYGISRNAGEEVTLVIKSFSANGDGSYENISTETLKLARVVDLQPNQIQRLQANGITIHAGVSVSITGELEKSPDQIIRPNGQKYKVIDFTISENASIMICDLLPLGAA